MYGKFQSFLQSKLQEIEDGGLYKRERLIQGPQGSHIRVKDRDVLNFCANNYLGLSSHPDLVKAAHEGLEKFGYGMSSVRFICGTQTIHKKLEESLSRFLGTQDTILFSSCFDANGGVFEALLSEEDAIISDELNHASIIDGIRLCKAQRYRYKHCDLSDLEARLREAQAQRFRLVVTDGAFSMDGTVAPLDRICALAEKYDALVMVDDSHASGFMGPGGRGTHEHYNVMNRVDIITSTLGKALGGSAGGFVSGHREIIDMLRQKARPYLFSNTLTPPVVNASVRALELVGDPAIGGKLREQLWKNTRRFREAMKAAGFTIKDGNHPVVPVMLGEASLAQKMAAELLEEGVYVIGFFFPVVPKGQARIRVQLSAAHSDADVEKAIGAFTRVGKKLGVIG
ncbi:MAG: glycine C-acetyltransferase [Bdellovibrionales bacterium]|nr:glycine C-acetyltransferase [Bdellovibrionales bacterium]